MTTTLAFIAFMSGWIVDTWSIDQFNYQGVTVTTMTVTKKIDKSEITSSVYLQTEKGKPTKRYRETIYSITYK